MDPQKFKKAVSYMRTCQREYFATRDRSVLQRSKAAEKRVDQMLAEDDGSEQASLFSGGM